MYSLVDVIYDNKKEMLLIGQNPDENYPEESEFCVKSE